MRTPAPDLRSSTRRDLDQQIADEPALPPLDLPIDAPTSALESHLTAARRPVAVAGVVENGLVRPLDPAIHLPEQSRVIIVAADV